MSQKFHFPPDIHLHTNPLLEAWLEIRWQLEPGKIPQMKRDPGFPFALGMFFENIVDEFSYREALDAAEMPEDVLPYVIRYQFRPQRGGSPILQLGPGVATVNFTDAYSWREFEKRCYYLRHNLLNAYNQEILQTKSMALRYRNGEPFDYRTQSLLGFIERYLNTTVELPNQIPGFVSKPSWPTSTNAFWSFELREPVGTGTLRFATGRQREESDASLAEGKPMLIWQLEVVSAEDNAPDVNSIEEFSGWLAKAHAVIHEWFFSLIDGPLLDEYRDKG